MREHPAPLRLSVDVEALERAAAALQPVPGSLRRGSSDLLRTAPDPGERSAADSVADLQHAASHALLALAHGLEESAALLSEVVRRHRGAEAEVGSALRRPPGAHA